MTDELKMIYPGDPRHPCPICNGSNTEAMHCMPCPPVPDYDPSIAVADSDISILAKNILSQLLQQKPDDAV